jgi:hypothetical protein
MDDFSPDNFSNVLSGIFARPNPNEPVSANAAAALFNTVLENNNKQEMQRNNSPLMAYIAQNPQIADQMVRSQAEALDLHNQTSGLSNQSTELQNQMLGSAAHKGELDMAATYPFLAVNLAEYPKGQDPAEIDKFMEQLKAGKQSGSLEALLSGGQGGGGNSLDTIKSLMGIQKEANEMSMNSPNTIIASAAKQYKFSNLDPRSNDPVTAKALSDMPPDVKKELQLLENNVPTWLNTNQDIINDIHQNGMPVAGKRRTEYEARLSQQFLSMYKTWEAQGGNMRVNPELLKMFKSMNGNLDSWKSVVWNSKSDNIKILQGMQDTILDNFNTWYPSSLGGPNWDRLAGTVKDSGLQEKVRRYGGQHSPTQPGQPRQPQPSYGSPSNTAPQSSKGQQPGGGMSTITYTNPKTKQSVTEQVPTENLNALKKEANKLGVKDLQVQ